MSKLRVLVTDNGTHPASKWADFAADDIIQITAQAPTTLLREASEFRGRLVTILTKHHQDIIDEERRPVKQGNATVHEAVTKHAASVVDQICQLAKGLSFEAHFNQDHVRAHIADVCSRYFYTTRQVERQAYNDGQARASKKKAKD